MINPDKVYFLKGYIVEKVHYYKGTNYRTDQLTLTHYKHGSVEVDDLTYSQLEVGTIINCKVKFSIAGDCFYISKITKKAVV